ncbi:nucleotidyl transferase AbiEii/AbiGii toxin family protein [Salipiger mucosus]|uniref:Nucleotidyl transferase AbiEii/AbiGii toxin family protein n=1 Tax=Salipiger mucosus DSM 16094 TaxID=1123237 RepID=S9SCT9_9RHOB|nr:nucleotidyl transferase AbiEii/AbiGii toxin family protein [Salipiger mucosus]EPX84044.1 hypothetical protein Salmuc_01819 [Salipiger mucosus DSM 16094]
MKNIGASIKDKLKQQARQQRVTMDFMMIRYANERLLGRLAASRWADDYCLKGGMLLPAWNDGDMFRPTADIDINGLNDGDLAGFKEMVLALSQMTPDDLGYDDGIDFLTETVADTYQREGGADGGKIEMKAKLHTSPIPVRIDVSFGNPVTPSVDHGDYPCLFRADKKTPLPMPKIHMYPPETAVSEKLHALASFGSFNTRIRDYYDLHILFEKFDFSDDMLAEAFQKTFAKQERDLPDDLPALSEEYAEENRGKWAKFNESTNLRDAVPDFHDVVTTIRDRLTTPLDLAREGSAGYSPA